MQTYFLKAKTRHSCGKNSSSILRRQGYLPAVMYGHGIENQYLKIKYHDFEAVYSKAGKSSLIDLEIEGSNPVKIKIQDVQIDPLSDRFIHIDFYKVKMDEKITAYIELDFVGESKAVKELGGTLVKNLEEIEVECLPGDLVHDIKVDVSQLETFDDVIHIKDLNVPERIEVLSNLEQIVANVMPPRSEEELEKEEEKETAQEIPVVEGEEREKQDVEDDKKEEVEDKKEK